MKNNFCGTCVFVELTILSNYILLARRAVVSSGLYEQR